MDNWIILLLTMMSLTTRITTTTAFTTPVKCSSSSRIIRPLQFSITSPFEEMEKEDEKKKEEEKDWTPVEGGFLPNIPSLTTTTTKAAPTPSTTKRKQSSKRKRITEVTTLEQYKQEVVDHGDDDIELVVVKFYSTWCRSCKAMQPLYERLAKTNSNKRVKFVQVPITKANSVLHTGLGIPSVPFGHIYHHEAGLVEERKLNKKEFKEFQHVLQQYVDGECDLKDHDEEEDESSRSSKAVP